VINATIGRVLLETSVREKGKSKARNGNEEEADSAGRNGNHSRRGRETNKETAKEKGTEEVRSAK
jgi:hypothetical protein